MRADIAKVLCERERRGRRGGKGKGYAKLLRSQNREDNEDVHSDLEYQPRQISHRRQKLIEFYELRDFSDRLGALKGLVRKAEGQPWDKVYAGICAVVPPMGNVTERHVHTHLHQFIETETRLNEAGEVEVHTFSDSWQPLASAWADYYVHPKTRLVTRIKRRSQRKDYRVEHAEMLAAYVRETQDPLVELHKVCGTWFSVTLEFLPTAYDMAWRYDWRFLDAYDAVGCRMRQADPAYAEVCHAHLVAWREKRTGRKQLALLKNKKALGTKELAALGLTNS
jgi:hypothetical protein